MSNGVRDRTAQTLRVRTVASLVRFEGLPGEFSQHDFGEVWVTYQDRTDEHVHFFESRLTYSRTASVRATISVSRGR